MRRSGLASVIGTLAMTAPAGAVTSTTASSLTFTLSEQASVTISIAARGGR